jgi:hypothetical protein
VSVLFDRFIGDHRKTGEWPVPLRGWWAYVVGLVTVEAYNRSLKADQVTEEYYEDHYETFNGPHGSNGQAYYGLPGNPVTNVDQAYAPAERDAEEGAEDETGEAE